MQEHLDEQLQHFGTYHIVDDEHPIDPPKEKTMLEVNTMNAQAKLKKYRKLLTAPVYPAALVLIPWNKWLYLDSVCNEEQLQGYKASVQALWDNKYAGLDVGEPSIEVEVAAAVPPQVSQPFFSLNRAKIGISSGQKGFSTLGPHQEL